MLLAAFFALVILIMKAATKARGQVILNAEDHRVSTIGGFIGNFLVFVLLSVVTPLTIGPLSVAGLMLIVPAAIIYVLSIVELIRNPDGLVVSGIYRISRNPMYVAMVDFLLAFCLMAAEYSPTIGLGMLGSTSIFMVLINARVNDEERFLSTRYPAEWRAYMQTTARYIPVVAK
jgi:protein-S-isoprenylcysteine O-methyltransferase Ste14